MKKNKWLIILVFICFVCVSSANAILTNQAPAKHKTKKIQTTPSNDIKHSTPLTTRDIANKNESNKEIEAYKKKVRETIDADVAKWRPYMGTKDLSAEIEFGIADNGRLNYSVVKKSSGQSWFDDNAKAAVLKIYDPLPESFHGTAPRMYDTSYGRGKCLVMTHTITLKAKLPEDYVKPKKEIDKNTDDHIKDIQESQNDLFLH